MTTVTTGTHNGNDGTQRKVNEQRKKNTRDKYAALLNIVNVAFIVCQINWMNECDIVVGASHCRPRNEWTARHVNRQREIAHMKCDGIWAPEIWSSRFAEGIKRTQSKLETIANILCKRNDSNHNNLCFSWKIAFCLTAWRTRGPRDRIVPLWTSHSHKSFVSISCGWYLPASVGKYHFCSSLLGESKPSSFNCVEKTHKNSKLTSHYSNADDL